MAVLLSERLQLNTIRLIMDHIRKTESVKDFFTSERWGEENCFFFSIDNCETPDAEIFRIVKKGESSPVVEMVDKMDSPALILIQLDKVLAEAKRRLGEK